MTAVLKVENLQHHYGGVWALQGVDFELQAGECVALIGPNGAGKSTCFACVAGQQTAAHGKVHWHQKDLARVSAKDRRALGIGRTFQVAQVFEALSVYQNLQLVLQAAKGVSAFDLLDHCQIEAASFWLEAMGLLILG